MTHSDRLHGSSRRRQRIVRAQSSVQHSCTCTSLLVMITCLSARQFARDHAEALYLCTGHGRRPRAPRARHGGEQGARTPLRSLLPPPREHYHYSLLRAARLSQQQLTMSGKGAKGVLGKGANGGAPASGAGGREARRHAAYGYAAAGTVLRLESAADGAAATAALRGAGRCAAARSTAAAAPPPGASFVAP